MNQRHERHGRHELEERIGRFRRSWDAGDLWPGVTESAFVRATEELARIIGVIAADAAHAANAALAGDRDLRVLGIAAHVSGVGPLLGYWIEQGRLEAPPEAARLFAAHLDHGRRRAERLARELERIARVMAAAGVTPTVLKGMHLAREYWPEPGTRPMADIDLLVAPAEAGAAAEALRKVGLEVSAANRGRTTWRAPGPHVPHSLEITDERDPWELDLHVSLDRWLADTVPARLDPVAPHELSTGAAGDRVLAQPLLTAFLAIHLADHFESAGLMRPLELGAVIRKDVERGLLRWDALLERLRATQADRLAYPAFELVEKLLSGTIDPAFRAAIREVAPARVRRVVDRTEPGRATHMFRRPAELRLMWIDGWRSAVRWLLWRLWPRPGGVPARPAEAARLTGSRLWRVVTGRMRWRAR
jgi:hypothetical protein